MFHRFDNSLYRFAERCCVLAAGDICLYVFIVILSKSVVRQSLGFYNWADCQTAWYNECLVTQNEFLVTQSEFWLHRVSLLLSG